ncbi:hypothetical protein IKA92_06500, partial [bacterium]|nr:hypothetical protein [bacterium]
MAVGGIAGYIENATIIGTHTLSTVTGNDKVGGLVGWANGGNISNVYSAGTVNANGANTADSTFGGLVGYAEGAITQEIAHEVMMTQEEAEAAGYIWVTTADELQTALANGQNVALGGNIDLAGVDWTSIENYSGTLEGNGYTISNLTGEQGLFKTLGKYEYDEGTGDSNYYGATIKNLNLENFNITSSSSSVGALAGGFAGIGDNYPYNSSSINIDNVHVVGGSVSGTNQVGGLIGTTYINDYDTCVAVNISNSSSSATVSGTNSVGGFIGTIDDNTDYITITNCSSYGDVSGTSQVGGFAGMVYGDSYG